MNWLLVGLLLLISPLFVFLIGVMVFIFAECLMCMWASVFAIFGFRRLERFCMKHCPHLYNRPFPDLFGK